MREFDPERIIKQRIGKWMKNEDPYIYGGLQ